MKNVDKQQYGEFYNDLSNNSFTFGKIQYPIASEDMRTFFGQVPTNNSDCNKEDLKAQIQQTNSRQTSQVHKRCGTHTGPRDLPYGTRTQDLSSIHPVS